MNKKLPVAGLLMAACLALVSAVPSFAFTSVNAEVPFSFKAGTETYPAGTYTLRWMDENDPQVLEIRSKDGKHHGTVNAENGAELKDPSENSRLTFTKVNNKHYLQKIEATGEKEVAEVSLPKAAKAKGMEPELVFVAFID